MVSIIIPCLNNADLTRDCINSIRAYTPEDHEIILIDNGSIDETPELLNDLARGRLNYIVLRNDTNIGFPRAVNQGILFSKGEHIVILNNDVIVSPEWLTGMLECMNSAPDIGIVGPRTNNISGRQIFRDGTYSNQFEFVEFARSFRNSYKGHYDSWWRIVFFCTLIKREVFEKIGVLDEQFSPGNFEDDDFCIRSVLGGYRNVICNDVFVHHFGSASHKDIDQSALLSVNHAKYRRKWAKWRDEHSTITCSMIVKNEGHRIAKCLEKIIPLVDEVVIVDTGSTDNTKEEISKFPDVKLYDFTWCDDFSAARNFADSKATKDWIFSLDADEVITEIDRSQLWPVTTYGYETRNYTSKVNYKGWTANTGEYPEYEEGVGWFPSLKIRLYPRDSRLHWSYPVHEVIEPSAARIGYERILSPIPVHHIGKINEEWDKEKGTKYYEYLRGKVADEPNDLRHVEELATQAQNLEKFDEAIGMWKKYLTFKLDKESEYNAYLNMGHCLACLNKTREALQSSMKAWKIKNDSREAATNVSILLYRLKHYDLADKVAVEMMNKHKEYPIPIAVHNACIEMTKEQTDGS